MRNRWVVVTLSSLIVVGAWSGMAEAALPGWAYGAGGKLTRGLMNVVTGWLELPNEIVDTTQQQNVLVGATWGTLKGLVKGVVREAVGVYETITFPVPVPANYAPILSPAYAYETPAPP